MLGLKKFWGFVFVAVLFVSVAGLRLADGAGILPPTYLPEIVIDAGGNVVSPVDLIRHSGNVYTLRGDLNGYALVIGCNNIVFHGAGHVINSAGGDNPGIGLKNADGVTIKNVQVQSRYTSIYLYSSSNCLITDVKISHRIYLTGGSNSNTITNNDISMLHISGSSNNLIVKNNVWTELGVSGSENSFYLNNFFLDDLPSIFLR